MSEMRRRVSQAIDRAFQRQRISATAWGGVPGIIPPINLDLVAEEVLREMREPTEAMIVASRRALVGVPSEKFMELELSGMRYATAEFKARLRWRAMIDAAVTIDHCPACGALLAAGKCIRCGGEER